MFRYLAPEWHEYADGSISYKQRFSKSLDVYAAAVIFWEVGSHKFAFGDPAPQQAVPPSCVRQWTSRNTGLLPSLM
jgi:hypothetical protein